MCLNGVLVSKGWRWAWQPFRKVTRCLCWSETRLEDPGWAWDEQVCGMWYFFLLSSLTLLVRWQEGHLACKKLSVSLLVMTIWHVIAPIVTTTSIILSSNKIQNGDILVPDYPGFPGKRLSKECCCVISYTCLNIGVIRVWQNMLRRHFISMLVSHLQIAA